MGAAGASIRTWPLLEINIKERRGAPTLKEAIFVTRRSSGWELLPLVAVRPRSLNNATRSDLGHLKGNLWLSVLGADTRPLLKEGGERARHYTADVYCLCMFFFKKKIRSSNASDRCSETGY